MENYCIKPCLISDLDALFILESKSFNRPYTQNMLEEMLLDSLSVTLKAEIDLFLVGYASVKIIFDEAHLISIAVDSRFRQRGIGKELLSQVISTAKQKGAEKLFLEVSQKNQPAIDLYSGFGFNQIGIRENYYDDGESAVVMLLLL